MGRKLKTEGKRGERTSPRKRKISMVESTPISTKNEKVKKSRKRSKVSPMECSPSTSFDCTPSTSYAPNRRSTRRKDSEEDYVCAFYRVTKNQDGTPKFNKKLLKYFMTVDSPEMDDLKNKRFNTSFLKVTPTNKDHLQIYTEEEDKDPKWLIGIPDVKTNFPEFPGTDYAHVFESMPIGDSDEEVKKSKRRAPSRRKSTRGRVTAFKGKPLPDQALEEVDYTGILDSDSSRDNDEEQNDGVAAMRDIINAMRGRQGEETHGKESTPQSSESSNDSENDKNNSENDSNNSENDNNNSENENNNSENVNNDSESDNNDSDNSNSSILKSLLSAPPSAARRPYVYNSAKPSQSNLLVRKKEDERLLQKYKDIMGNKTLNVVMKRLPVEGKFFQLCERKKKSD